MKFFFPIFLLISSIQVFSQSKNVVQDPLGAKPGIIINTNYDCKIGHLNLSCVPAHCDSISIFPGDTIQFCTDSIVDLISDPLYYIQWNFTGSSNYPNAITDHYPISHSICYVAQWTIPGSYDVEIFYNGWLSAHPNSDCYAQGPSHWIIRVNVGALNAIKDEGKNEKVLVYPNPVTNKLTIDLPVGEKGMLEIYSVLGEKMQTGELENGKNAVSIENLSSGIYFYKLFQNEKLIAADKIIVIN